MSRRLPLASPQTEVDFTTTAVGADGLPMGGSSSTSPQFVTAAQGTPTFSTINLAAGVAQNIIPALATIRGARVLNWILAPVYMSPGVSGTPASGAPSDYIPAAVTGPVPAQFEFPYAPTNGVQAVCATAGTLTVEIW